MAICLVWAGFEFLAGSVGWGLVSAILGAIAFYKLFVTFERKKK